jgi:hypothetical protein
MVVWDFHESHHTIGSSGDGDPVREAALKGANEVAKLAEGSGGGSVQNQRQISQTTETKPRMPPQPGQCEAKPGSPVPTTTLWSDHERWIINSIQLTLSLPSLPLSVNIQVVLQLLKSSSLCCPPRTLCGYNLFLNGIYFSTELFLCITLFAVCIMPLLEVQIYCSFNRLSAPASL